MVDNACPRFSMCTKELSLSVAFANHCASVHALLVSRASICVVQITDIHEKESTGVSIATSLLSCSTVFKEIFGHLEGTC